MNNTLFLYLTMACVTCLLSRLVPDNAFAKSPYYSRNLIISYIILSLPCIFIHTLFWGLRDGVGTDYFNYVRWFETAGYVLDIGAEPEIVFLYLCRGLELLGFTSISLFIVTSFINIASIFIVGRQYDKITLTFMVLFFYLSVSVFNCQNEVRHCLSISVLLPLINCLDIESAKKRYLIVLALGIIAFFIHRSSLLYFISVMLLYYAPKIKIPALTLWVIYVFLEFYGPRLQISILDNSLGLITALGYEDQLYSAYSQAGEGISYNSGMGIPLRILLNSIVIYVFSKYINNEEEKNSMYYFFIIFFIGMLLDRILSGTIVLRRVAGVFYYAKFTALGLALSCLLKNKIEIEKIMGYILIIGYLLLFIMAVLINSNGVVPYKMIKL